MHCKAVLQKQHSEIAPITESPKNLHKPKHCSCLPQNIMVHPLTLEKPLKKAAHIVVY